MELLYPRIQRPIYEVALVSNVREVALLNNRPGWLIDPKLSLVQYATRELGYRTRREIDSAREAAIERQALTEIDHAILSRAHFKGRVSYGSLSGTGSLPDLHELQKIRRLNFLERMGLAKEMGAGRWELSAHTQRRHAASCVIAS